MKLAIMVSGILAGRRAGDAKELLAKAGSAVSSSPELSQLSSTLRGRLVEAAKTAAVAAASKQIDSLGDSLTERAAKIRSPQPASAEPDEEERAEEERSDEAVPAQRHDEQEQSSTDRASEPDRSQQRSTGAEKPTGTSARPRKPDTSHAAPKRPKGVSSSASGARSRRGGGDHA
jgi:hypothetical protein